MDHVTWLFRIKDNLFEAAQAMLELKGCKQTDKGKI